MSLCDRCRNRVIENTKELAVLVNGGAKHGGYTKTWKVDQVRCSFDLPEVNDLCARYHSNQPKKERRGSRTPPRVIDFEKAVARLRGRG